MLIRNQRNFHSGASLWRKQKSVECLVLITRFAGMVCLLFGSHWMPQNWGYERHALRSIPWEVLSRRSPWTHSWQGRISMHPAIAACHTGYCLYTSANILQQPLSNFSVPPSSLLFPNGLDCFAPTFTVKRPREKVKKQTATKAKRKHSCWPLCSRIR